MSQKINPLSNRLGILQLWDYNHHKYGKNFKSYVKFIQFETYITNYINRFLNKHNLLVENINIIQTVQKTVIEIFILDLKNNYSFDKKIFLTNTISHWLNHPVVVLLYKSNKLGTSSFLITNYVYYLFLQKVSSSKKLLQFVYKILRNQLQRKKIIYTINGVKTIKLKGFKIELSGCFESSRSQMARTVKYSFGSSSLTKLKGYIDYSDNVLFTKFGSCGIKVWLFYEFM